MVSSGRSFDPTPGSTDDDDGGALPTDPDQTDDLLQTNPLDPRRAADLRGDRQDDLNQAGNRGHHGERPQPPAESGLMGTSSPDQSGLADEERTSSPNEQSGLLGEEESP